MEREMADVVYIFVSPDQPGIKFYDRSPEPGSQLAAFVGTPGEGKYYTHPTDVSEAEWDPSMNEENKTYLIRYRDGDVKVTTIMVSPEQMQKIREEVARNKDSDGVIIDTGRTKQNDFSISDGEIAKIEQSIINQPAGLSSFEQGNSTFKKSTDDIPVIDISELGVELPRFDGRGDEPDFIEGDAKVDDSNSNSANGFNISVDENIVATDKKDLGDTNSIPVETLNNLGRDSNDIRNSSNEDFFVGPAETVIPPIEGVEISSISNGNAASSVVADTLFGEKKDVSNDSVSFQTSQDDANFQAFLNAKDEALRGIMSGIGDSTINLNNPSGIADSDIDFKEPSGKGIK